MTNCPPLQYGHRPRRLGHHTVADLAAWFEEIGLGDELGVTVSG